MVSNTYNGLETELSMINKINERFINNKNKNVFNIKGNVQASVLFTMPGLYLNG